MRKIISLFTALAMLLCALPALAEEAPTAITLGVETDYENVQSLAWVGDTLYILGRKGVYAWQKGQGSASLAVDLSASAAWQRVEAAPTNPQDAAAWAQAVQFLMGTENALFALQPYSGQVFRVADGALTEAFRLDTGVFVSAEGFRREILSALWMDGACYLLLGTDSWDQPDKTTLVRFDADSGAATVLPAEGLQAIAPGTQGKLLAVTGAQADTLTLVDAATGAPDAPLLSGLGTTISGLAMYNGQSACYTDSRVLLVGTDGSAQTKGYLPVVFHRAGTPAACSAAGLYAYGDSACVYLRDLSLAGEPAVTVLRLMGYMDTRVLQAYAIARPDVAIQVVDPYSVASDQPMTELMRAMDIDMAIVSAPGTFTSLCRKGYAADLSASQAITKAAEGLDPAIRQALGEGGSLLGFPLNLQPSSWTVNETRWEALGLPDVPATWEELYALIDLWLKDYAADYPDEALCDLQCQSLAEVAVQLTLAYLLQNETTGEEVNFDTPDFRALMQGLMDNAALFSPDNEQWGEPLLASYYQGFGVTYNDANRMRMVLPPAVSKEAQVLQASMEVLMVCASSARQDAAMDFVAFAAESMTDATRYAMYPGLNEPVRNPNYETRIQQVEEEVADLESRLAAAEPADKPDIQAALEAKQSLLERVRDNEWEISPEAIAAYRAAARHMRVPYDSAYLADGSGSFGALAEIVYRYWENGLTADQLNAFIAEMNRVSRMVYLEAQ